MAKGNCEDCRYGEYKPRDEFHLGTEKDEPDVWCTYYEKWVRCGSSGGCEKYE